MLAGYESTALALAACIYMLARHPAAEQKLLQELVQANVGQQICYEDLIQFPYASAVLKEALRLQGPVALHPRVATKNTHVSKVVTHQLQQAATGFQIYVKAQNILLSLLPNLCKTACADCTL